MTTLDNLTACAEVVWPYVVGFLAMFAAAVALGSSRMAGRVMPSPDERPGGRR